MVAAEMHVFLSRVAALLSALRSAPGDATSTSYHSTPPPPSRRPCGDYRPW